MKIRIENYTFDASAKTVTFTDYGSISLEGVLLITNATDQIIIYNFADTAKGGTAATNVLTLEHDTTSMADADKLLIYYDDAVNLTKTEDVAHASGDAGVMPLTVRCDDICALAGTDGDYQPFVTNEHGILRTQSQQHYHIDCCEATTGWTVLGNDTVNLATTTNHVLGTLALEFDKVDGAANTVFAGIQKTVSSLDLDPYHKGGGFFCCAIYASSIADVAYAFLRVGTDSSNYNEWRGDVDEMSVGWNTFKKRMDKPDTHAGNGWNSSAVTYVAIGIAFGNETDALADIAVDHIAVNTGLQTTTDFIQTETQNINLHKVGNKVTDIGAGNAGVGTQRVSISTDDVNLAAIKTAVEVIDNAVATEGSALGSGVLLQGDDGTDRTNVLVDATGHLQVDVLSGGGAGTQYTEDAAAPADPVGGTLMMTRDDQLSAVTEAAGDWSRLRGTAKGALWVSLADASGDPITAFGGGTEYTEDVATANPQVGKAMMMERDDVLSAVTPAEGDWIGTRGTAEGALWVQDFNSDAILADTASMDTNLGTIAGDTTSIDGKITACNTGAVVLAAGTAGIGKLTANTGVDIGDVTINNAGSAAAVNIQDGGNSITVDGTFWQATQPVSIAGTVTVDLGANNDVTVTSGSIDVLGDTAHDAADSGDPVKIGHKAVLFNSSAPPNAAAAENDRVNSIADEYGRQYVETTHPNYWDVSADYAGAQTNTTVKAAAGAGLSLYITDIIISNGATAGNITLLDGSGGTVLIEIYPAINGGLSTNLRTPIKLTANTLLAITSTTVTTHSLTISGFIAP